jgi:hypothetical protein
MELRSEPRFGTRTSGVVEAIRDKLYTYDITITEVSGIGLRIEMAEELKVGENVRLLVDGYHMFAQVRRCVPSESGFTIGVERIDAWNAPPPESALLETATPSAVKVLGRPKLRNPLDNLRGAALRGLFADPRLRTTVQAKYQTVFIVAGCVALAGWAGFGAGVFLHGKPQSATAAKTEAAQQVPGTPKVAGDVAPPKTDAKNLVASKAGSPTVVAPPVQKAAVEVPPVQKTAVEVPPVQKAEVAAPPKLAARPAIAPASRISIKASDISWVTACADGAKVLDMLLTKGYAGGVSFSQQATLRFGNAGAIELAVGNQAPARLGRPGEIRTIKVTPAGYEPMTIQSAFNCNLR